MHSCYSQERIRTGSTLLLEPPVLMHSCYSQERIRTGSTLLLEPPVLMHSCYSQERIRTGGTLLLEPPILMHSCYSQEPAAKVRACNSVKFETSWNLPPVLKIVTCTAQLCIDISHGC